jgi:myosin heavy subunit
MVTHYAGQINYDVKGMLDKNRDSLPNSIMFTMKSKQNLLLYLFGILAPEAGH